MIYVVTHYQGYEDSEVVAAYRSLSEALDYTQLQAEAHAALKNEEYRYQHEATITRYRNQIARFGPDHIPDELTFRTTSFDKADPWDTMTLAERLRTIENRGFTRAEAHPIEGGVGHTADFESWYITPLEES